MYTFNVCSDNSRCLHVQRKFAQDVPFVCFLPLQEQSLLLFPENILEEILCLFYDSFANLSPLRSCVYSMCKMCSCVKASGDGK